MNFDIPVILTPGEILSVNNTSNFSTDGVLDLHLHAVVKNPKNFSDKDKQSQTDFKSFDHGKFFIYFKIKSSF